MVPMDDDDDFEPATSDGSGDDSDDSSEVSDSSAAPSGFSVNPVVAAYLQNKSDLQAAQKKQSYDQLLAGLARASGTLANSGGGMSTVGVNNSAYDALDQAAASPVTNVLSGQKAAAQAIGNQSALQSAAVSAQKDDPSSPQSKAVQNMIKRLYPGKFSDEDLASITANDADSIYKPLELDEKIKERQQEHEDSREEKSDKAGTKTSLDQAKSYTAMRKDLETFRGNQSAQQAALAVQNSDKALALVQSTPTIQNLNLLADEMGKIATGGVPGEHGTQALLPNNLYTKVAEMKAWVTGHPNAAAPDVQEYLQNNQDYINQVKQVSSQTLHSYRTNIAKGYKGRVNPDNYQEAVDDYGLGGTASPASGSAAPPATSGAPVARKTPDGRTALFDPVSKKFLRYQ